MIGVSERTTMDMDASVCGITVDKDTLERTFKEILSIDVGDGIVFRYDYRNRFEKTTSMIIFASTLSLNMEKFAIE